MGREKLVAAVVVVAVLVIGAGLYVYLPGLLNHPTAGLSFKFDGGSARYNTATGLTNVTLRLRNTGSVPLRLGGEGGVAPPQPYQYVTGSFQAYFFNSNGTQIFGGSGTSPDTSKGGLVVATYLITNAQTGDRFTITTQLTGNGETYSQSISLTVVACVQATVGCPVSTASSTTTSISTSTAFTSSVTKTSMSISSNSTTTSVSTSPTGTSTSTSQRSVTLTSVTQSTTTTSNTTTSTSTTVTTTTKVTTSKSTTSTVSSGAGTLAWRFVNATASYDPTSGVTSVTVWIQNTGSVSFGPKGTNPAKTPAAIPNGTAYVSGSWMASFYDSSGTFLCNDPCGGPPATAGGGWVKVAIQVTGAPAGDDLNLAYTIDWDGQTAGPNYITFVVS